MGSEMCIRDRALLYHLPDHPKGNGQLEMDGGGHGHSYGRGHGALLFGDYGCPAAGLGVKDGCDMRPSFSKKWKKVLDKPNCNN